jgi:DNA-binding NarL/FixJ family response regulator
LQQLDRDVEIVEAGNCAQALAAVETHCDFSLILLDLHMPDGNGITALETIKLRHPAPAVLVLSASENRDDMQRALKKGALGFIPKTATPAVMLGALRLVLAGGIYIPPEMLDQSTDNRSAEDGTAPELSPRQLEVLARSIEGKPYNIIARELGLAESTVKTHLIAAFRVLGVSNRMQAARKVQQLKLRLPPT